MVQLEAVAKARDWTAGMAAYDLVLAKMKPLSAAQDAFQQEPSIKASKKKRKQPEPTEAPAAAAAVPQPQSATAKASKSKTKKVKKQRNAAADSATVPSSAAASQAPQPLAITAAAMVTAPKATTSAQQAKGRHVGRYHRVTSAKKAKGYSSSDLAAILGVEALPVAVPTAVTATPAAAQVPSLTLSQV